jgi:hypothetical protein
MSAAIAAVPLPLVAIAVVAPAFPMSQPERARQASTGSVVANRCRWAARRRRWSEHAERALVAPWLAGAIVLPCSRPVRPWAARTHYAHGPRDTVPLGRL